jgi:hypothetical protein
MRELCVCLCVYLSKPPFSLLYKKKIRFRWYIKIIKVWTVDILWIDFRIYLK